MLPLTFANVDEDCIIKKVNGSRDVKKHLEDMGFVQGATVSLVSTIEGNLIVKIKGSRVAISKEMASKIMI